MAKPTRSFIGSSVEAMKTNFVSFKERLARRKKLIAGVFAGLLVLGGGGWVAAFGLPDWEVLDEIKSTVAGKPTLADLAKRARAEPKNAELQVDLGHARFEAGQRGPALRAYDRALRLDKAQASRRMVDNLVSCFGLGEQLVAQAILTRYQLTDADDGLHKLLDHKHWAIRGAALTTLTKLGKTSRGDYLTVWSLDLKSSECDLRRHAVEKLGELGDRRAVDDIRAAKKRDRDETPWYSSSCLGNRTENAERKILAKK